MRKTGGEKVFTAERFRQIRARAFRESLQDNDFMVRFFGAQEADMGEEQNKKERENGKKDN